MKSKTPGRTWYIKLKSPRNGSEGRQEHLFVSGQLIIRLDVALFLTILTQIMPMQRRRIKKLLASTVLRLECYFTKTNTYRKGQTLRLHFFFQKSTEIYYFRGMFVETFQYLVLRKHLLQLSCQLSCSLPCLPFWEI